MFGKAFTWVRRFFELAGAMQTLGSVGGATILAIVIPAVLGAALNLPTGLLVLLGIGVFFVALAVILAILKAILERRAPSEPDKQASANAAQDPLPSSVLSESSHPLIHKQGPKKTYFKDEVVYISPLVWDVGEQKNSTLEAAPIGE